MQNSGHFVLKEAIELADNKTNLLMKYAVPGAIIFFLILAALRFHAGYLEQRVADISRAIEQISMEEVSLNQQLSALKSPNMIYSYCRDTLKMQRSTNVRVLKIIKVE